MALFRKKQNEDQNGAIKVLLLGLPRMGKSSMLASMLNHMCLTEERTGFTFTPDDDTRRLMQSKLHNLQDIFRAYPEDALFDTREGMSDDIVYGESSMDSVSYRFSLALSGKKADKQVWVEFVDPRGELMKELELEELKELVATSSIVMVAVDTPALMEEPIDGLGYFHKKVNHPEMIYPVISQLVSPDASEAKQMPKLVLFVPLKCEKYYHEDRMPEVVQAVQRGYANAFDLLNNPEVKDVSVGVVPILTMGDVVFSHYQKVTRRDGVEVLSEKKPRLFAFRTRDAEGMPHKPCFSPMFCEQPLYYVLSYILSLRGYTDKLEEERKKQKEMRTIGGKVKRLAFSVLKYYIFGWWYVAYETVKFLTNDTAYVERMERLSRRINLRIQGANLLIRDDLQIRRMVGE